MHIFPDCRCADGYTLHAENSHMPYCSPPTASHDEEVSHLTRFRGISVPGGRQEETPGTLLQGFRARWKAGKDTWNAFAGIPCQVDSRKRHLERFCRDSVPGGQQKETPGTLSREFRARWKAGKATWNTFAGIPCQVEGRKSYLEHFRRNSVPGGRQEKPPGSTKPERLFYIIEIKANVIIRTYFRSRERFYAQNNSASGLLNCRFVRKLIYIADVAISGKRIA